MDVLKVGTRNYVKASVIARELGYTADYVGQLCRSGKVDAKLFGRSWYVDQDSIKGHKSTRYRSTQTKSIEALQKKVPVDVTPNAEKRSIEPESRFYLHNKLKPSPRYVPDDSELLPQIGSASVKKTGSLRVGLADSSSVKITSESDRYVFNTPKVPTIKFKGALSVTDFDTTAASHAEGETVIHPKMVASLRSERRKAKKSVLIPHRQKRHFETKIVPIEIDPDGAVGVLVQRTGDRQGNGFFFTVISLCLLFSFVCLIFLFGVESHFTVEGTSVSTSYIFRGDLLLSTAKSLLERAGSGAYVFLQGKVLHIISYFIH